MILGETEMIFLSNIYDPEAPNAKNYIVTHFGETREESREKHIFWLRDKIIGEPQPTAAYTKEQLVSMNMVGVYKV